MYSRRDISREVELLLDVLCIILKIEVELKLDAARMRNDGEIERIILSLASYLYIAQMLYIFYLYACTIKNDILAR